MPSPITEFRRGEGVLEVTRADEEGERAGKGRVRLLGVDAIEVVLDTLSPPDDAAGANGTIETLVIRWARRNCEVDGRRWASGCETRLRW